MKKYKLNINYLVKKVIYNDKKLVFDGEFDFYITLNNTIFYFQNKKNDLTTEKIIITHIAEMIEAEIKKEYSSRQNINSKYSTTYIKKLVLECIKILEINGFKTYEELQEIDLNELVISEIINK